MIQKIFANVDVSKIAYREILGLNFAHYEGIVDRKCPDGQMLYMEVHIYNAPCCSVTFVATCGENETYKIQGVFERFTSFGIL